MKAHSMVFEGASPFQTLSIGSFQCGHTYIYHKQEKHYIWCVRLIEYCFNMNVLAQMFDHMVFLLT